MVDLKKGPPAAFRFPSLLLGRVAASASTTDFVLALPEWSIAGPFSM